MFGEIDHVGVAVEDLDESIALYRDRLGMREQHRETVEEFGVEAALLEVGGSHVELLTPIRPDTSVAKFLDRNGAGMHHVAYRTDDIDGTLARLRDAGMRLIDEQPRKGILDSRVAFVHPKSTGGGLTRVHVGFQGGQVLPLRAPADALEQLIRALKDDASPRWHALETEDDSVLIDLSQVVYLQREGGDHKVGF
jgi:methylmalonyl-CoA/ethylmalonyl-CoA epimerase